LCFHFLITNAKNEKKNGSPIEVARRSCETPAVLHVCNTQYDPAKVYETSLSVIWVSKDTQTDTVLLAIITIEEGYTSRSVLMFFELVFWS